MKSIVKKIAIETVQDVEVINITDIVKATVA